MRFGIYCEMQTPPGKSFYDMTWEIMRQIEHADECGFDVYSVIDHHFFQKFSISANPLAMFAAAAQRTAAFRIEGKGIPKRRAAAGTEELGAEGFRRFHTFAANRVPGDFAQSFAADAAGIREEKGKKGVRG